MQLDEIYNEISKHHKKEREFSLSATKSEDNAVGLVRLLHMGLPTSRSSGRQGKDGIRSFGVEVNLETTDNQVSFCELRCDGQWGQSSSTEGS